MAKIARGLGSLLHRGTIIGVGVAGSQIIGFLSLPILARLFTPADFGIFGSFYLGSQFLATVLALRYEQAIFLSAPGAPRRQAVTLCILVSLISALALIIIGLGAWLLGYTNVYFAGITIICGLLSSFASTLTAYAVTADCYRIVSVSRLVRAGVSVMMQIMLHKVFGLGLSALVLGETVAAVASCLILLFVMNTRLRSREKEDKERSAPTLREIAWRFRDQPLWNLPQTASNGVSRWLSVVIINAMFSAHDAGQFYFMQRILLTPSVFIGGALSQVYFKNAVDQSRETGDFWPVFRPLCLMLAGIGLLVAVLVLLFGEWIFRFVLGPEWGQAGQMAEVYAPYVALHLILSVLGPTTLIAQRQRAMLFVTLGQTLAFLVPLAIVGMKQVSLIEALHFPVCVSLPYMLGMVCWYGQLAAAKVSRDER